MNKVNRPAVAFLALALLLPHHASNAQTATSHPLTIVVPYAPGAQADLNMRLIAKKVTENGGRQIVIKNVPGAGTVVGTIGVKTAAPDGNTLLQMTVGAQLTNEMTTSPPPYVTAKDFEPITLLWSFPLTVVVPASSTVRTMVELIQSARSSKGGLSYGSPGVNSGSHFLGTMITQKTGASLVHVPYRANPARLSALPNVPTFAEAGLSGVEMGTQFGLLAPAATSKAVIKKLADEFARAARDPVIVNQAESQGIEIQTSTPDEFATLIADESKKLKLLLQSLAKAAL